MLATAIAIISFFAAQTQSAPNFNSGSKCDRGWHYLRSTHSCYETGDATQTFVFADFYCKQKQAHVASIHSDEENEFVANNISLASTNFQWVGLIEKGSNWINTDGSPLNYNRWVKGQHAHYNCTATNKFRGYQWNYINCKSFANYVCKKNAYGERVTEPSTKPSVATTTTKPTTTTTKSVTCAPGWELFISAKSCYKVGRGYKTFAAAEEDCQVEGAHVVSINSLSEQEFVVGILPRRHWLGMTKYNGKDWIWTDGTFLGWSKLEDDIKDRKCAMMRSFMQNSGWESTDCDREELYICEKPAV